MSNTLLRGGRIHAPDVPDATALLVRDGLVAWVGAGERAGPADEVIELDGALVTPAFVDAHVHATSTGLALEGLDLSACQSLSEALDLLARQVRANQGRVVLGTGWDETRWPERRPPTRTELDRASFGGVVYLARADVHSAVVSSALLAAVPEARGQDGFDPSGHVTRAAHHVLRRAALGSISPATRRSAQRATRARAAALGIGCLHELGGPDISGEDDMTSLLTLAAAEPGPEVIGYWGGYLEVETARRLGCRGAAGDLFVDGSLGSHTAALHEPYADAPTAGACYLDAEQVRAHVIACTLVGLQAGFHVIGDRAASTVVAGLEAAAGEIGAAAVVAGRHRLEHVEMLDERLVRTLVRLGVTASVQPAFDAAWGGPHGMYAQRLGVVRAGSMNAFASMHAAGMALAFGSDAPVTALDPWGAVLAATWHRSAEQRISVHHAFTAHTAGGWLAAGESAPAGTLALGAPATYAVWQAGALTTAPNIPVLPVVVPDEPLPRCLRTVVRGQTVFSTD